MRFLIQNLKYSNPDIVEFKPVYFTSISHLFGSVPSFLHIATIISLRFSFTVVNVVNRKVDNKRIQTFLELFALFLVTEKLLRSAR